MHSATMLPRRLAVGATSRYRRASYCVSLLSEPMLTRRASACLSLF